MDLALLTYAFGLGMLATFNPCGFALLPAYLAYFVGLESSSERNLAHNIIRGLIVGLTLTAGFLVVFGSIGWLASTIISQSDILGPLSWATFIIGILMIPLGAAMLAGFEPKLSLPRFNKGGTSRQLPSVFLFGISFAIVSLGCTAPLFFGAIASSFTNDGIWEGTLVFVSYGLGIGVVVMFLTVATAMSRTEIAVAMRRILPYVNRISGALLVLAGAFLIVYGWFEIQALRGNFDSNWLVDISEMFQANMTNWVADIGELRLALALLMLLLLVLGPTIRKIGLGSMDDETGELQSSQSPQPQSSQSQSWLLPQLSSRVWFWSIWVPLWVLAVLAWEIFRYDFELLTLPIWRTLIDIPSRISGWFTEPGRWAVLFEIIASALVGFFIWLRVRSARMKSSGEMDETDEMEETDETDEKTGSPVKTS